MEHLYGLYKTKSNRHLMSKPAQELSNEMRVMLHLGAHKTASTHFNRTLRRNKPLTQKNNIAVPKKDAIRALVTRRLMDMSMETARALQDDVLADLLDGQDTMFLSDENILGTSVHLFSENQMYHTAAWRVKRATQILGQDGVELMLAVRNPADFLVSAYGETIRSYGYVAFRDYLDGTPVAELSWTKLVRRLMRASGGRPMTVWTYENYHDTLPQLMNMVLGQPMTNPVDYTPIDEIVRPGLSQRAIDEIQHACEVETADTEQISFEDIVKAYPKSADCPAPDPWTAGERMVIDTMYRRDLRKIANMDGVTFLG